MSKSKTYLKDNFKVRVSTEYDLKELEPSVHQTCSQVYGLMFVRLEKCPSCKRWCVEKELDETTPHLMEYNYEAQLKRNNWAIRSDTYSSKLGGWLCIECENKILGHKCKSCRKVRA